MCCNRFISKHAPTPNSSNKSTRDDDTINDQMSYTTRYLEGNMKNYSESSQQFHHSFTDSNLSKSHNKQRNGNKSHSIHEGSGLFYSDYLLFFIHLKIL